MNGAKPTYVVDADKLLSSNPKELWAYRELYLFLVKRDFVAAYKQTVLGPLFFFVQPFLASIVFLIVFGQIARFAYRRAAVARVLHLGHHRVELFSQLLESGIVHFSREWRPLREDLIPSTGDSAEPDQHERSEFRYSIAGAICGNCLYQLSGRRIEIGLKVLVLPAILLALLALDLGCLIVSATVKYRDLNIVVGCTGVSSSIPGQPVRSVGNPCGAESDDEPD